MNRQNIESLVEEYLNSIRDDLPIDFDKGTSYYEQFKLHTVKRLKNTYELFRKNDDYLNDFLISLRDYLIAFKTDIQLSSISIPQDNDFAIIKGHAEWEVFLFFSISTLY